MNKETIKTETKAFLQENLGGGISGLTDQTQLISSRIMDSILALRLVTFLEEKFGIEFEAHEVTEENLNTLEQIASFVLQKMK